MLRAITNAITMPFETLNKIAKGEGGEKVADATAELDVSDAQIDDANGNLDATDTELLADDDKRVNDTGGIQTTVMNKQLAAAAKTLASINEQLASAEEKYLVVMEKLTSINEIRAAMSAGEEERQAQMQAILQSLP